MNHDDLLQHAIAAYGFLVPWNQTETLGAFAGRVRAYSDHPRAQALTPLA